MPQFNATTSVPASGTANPIAGSMWEYLPFDAHLSFGLNQASGAVGAVVATVTSGSDVLMEEGPLPVQARMPINPDDFFMEDDAAAGDRLRVQLRNTTGGAIVVNTSIKIEPI